MNLQSILGYSLAGVSLVVSIGFFMHRPITVETAKSDIPQAPTSYTEPMPSSSEESYRIHILNAAGAETEVRIKYKDGSDGFLKLGSHGKTVHEHRAFPDGTDRKDAVYDADGVLISGYEYRSDRTPIWTTALSSDQSKTVTLVFWPGGQVFLERGYERQSKISQSTFYRVDGSRWQETEYQDDLLVMRKSYDETGRLRLFLQLSDPETGAPVGAEMYRQNYFRPFIRVVYFQADGRPDFEQWFAYEALHNWDPESGQPNPNKIFVRRVGIYTDGRLTTEITLTSDQRIKSIDLIDASGTIERMRVQSNGSITQIDTITPSGVSTRYDFEGGFGKASPIDSRYLVPLLDKDVPMSQFNANESRWHEPASTKPE